jgi:pimeloyl-ACP methyl ester carboxylesterase
LTLPEATHTETSDEKIERTIEVQGIQTHLFEAGEATAPPLLYLHGTSLGNLWLDYHTALSQHFHIFAPDTPGFGLTMRPDWMRDMDDYILYFRDMLAILRLEKPSSVGHSLGGWMAAELAIWYPERIGKLVLSNAAGIRVKGLPIADLFAMNPLELFATIFDNPIAGMVLMPQEVTVDYLLDQYRQRTTLASLAWNPSFDRKLERRLASIDIPTLVVWGENDRLIPPVYGDAFHKAIVGSKLVKLAGTGHMPMFEQPVEWTQVIADFLLETQSQEATHA